MADLIWMIKRVRHMIEAATSTTIVFTDHAVNPSIIRQTTLSSSSTDKLNLRLIRASTYLNQFRLNVKYRLGKLHVIPDALSRLSAASSPSSIDPQIDEPEALDIDAFLMGTAPALSKQRISCENRPEVLNLNTYHNGLENPEIPDQVYAYQGILMTMSPKFKQRLIDEYAKKKP